MESESENSDSESVGTVGSSVSAITSTVGSSVSATTSTVGSRRGYAGIDESSCELDISSDDFAASDTTEDSDEVSLSIL